MTTKKLYIEMVEVCINYSDLLKITLPTAKLHFDNIVIVTSPEDKKTIGVINCCH